MGVALSCPPGERRLKALRGYRSRSRQGFNPPLPFPAGSCRVEGITHAGEAVARLGGHRTLPPQQGCESLFLISPEYPPQLLCQIPGPPPSAPLSSLRQEFPLWRRKEMHTKPGSMTSSFAATWGRVWGWLGPCCPSTVRGPGTLAGPASQGQSSPPQWPQNRHL